MWLYLKEGSFLCTVNMCGPTFKVKPKQTESLHQGESEYKKECKSKGITWTNMRKLHSQTLSHAAPFCRYRPTSCLQHVFLFERPPLPPHPEPVRTTDSSTMETVCTQWMSDLSIQATSNPPCHTHMQLELDCITGFAVITLRISVARFIG